MFGATCLTATAPIIRRLAELEPRTLAIMHGPAHARDCASALLDLADAHEGGLASTLELAGSAR